MKKILVLIVLVVIVSLGAIFLWEMQYIDQNNDEEIIKEAKARLMNIYNPVILEKKKLDDKIIIAFLDDTNLGSLGYIELLEKYPGKYRFHFAYTINQTNIINKLIITNDKNSGERNNHMLIIGNSNNEIKKQEIIIDKREYIYVDIPSREVFVKFVELPDFKSMGVNSIEE